MTPPSIVEQLDILKQVLFGFLFRMVVLVINQLCFQRTEEALRDRIVQAFVFPTHATQELMPLQ